MKKLVMEHGMVASISFVCIMSGIQAMSLPILVTEGTHYEVGLDIGSTFQTRIQQFIDSDTKLNNVFLPWSVTAEGKQIIKGFLSSAMNVTPNYVKELEGISMGANISFMKIFLENLSVELSTLLLNGTHLPDACSDILVNRPNDGCVAIGHNEDNNPLIKELGYIVQAKIYDSNDLNHRRITEEFTAYCYPGGLPGNAFGFNSQGVTLSVNALFPKLVRPDKLGRTFLTRSLLASKSIAEMKNVLTRKPGTAYGFSANVGKLGKQPTMWNIEVAPSNKMTTNLDITEIKPYIGYNTSSDSVNGNYFHVNMYRRLKIEQLPRNIVSSEHRTTRIEELPIPKNTSGINYILGDEADKLYPIYRSPRKTDEEATAATGIFDLQNCTLMVFKTNPRVAEGPICIFPLPC